MGWTRTGGCVHFASLAWLYHFGNQLSIEFRREGEHGPFLRGDWSRAIVERLLEDADDNVVAAVELDPAAFAWVGKHSAGARVILVTGDSADEDVAEKAVDLVEEAGTLSGWVNNAAVFRDASIHSDGACEVLDAVALNLNPAVVGCATAIR